MRRHPLFARLRTWLGGVVSSMAALRPVPLAAVVACCLLAVLAAGCTTYQLLTDDPAPIEQAPVEQALPRPTPGDAAPPPEGPGEPSWRAAAAVYGEEFTNTTGGRTAWLSRMEDLSSPTLAEGYRSTDLTAVPTAAFVGFTGGQTVAGETPSRAVRLHYADGLDVDVTISQDPTTELWVITTAAPAEGPPPGAPGSSDGSDGPAGRVVA